MREGTEGMLLLSLLMVSPVWNITTTQTAPNPHTCSGGKTKYNLKSSPTISYLPL